MKLGLNVKSLLFTSVSMLLLLAITLTASLHLSGEAQQHQLSETITLLDTQLEAQQQLLQEGLQQKSDNLSGLLTMIAPQAIFSFDFDALQSYAEAAVRDKEIDRVRFLNAQGETIADSDLEQPSMENPQVSIALELDGESLGTLQMAVNHNHIDTAMNHTRINNERYQEQIRSDTEAGRSNTLYWSILFGVITLLATAIVSILYIRSSITAPIQQVIELFKQIGSGKYDNEITTRRKDEIGQLFLDLQLMQQQLSDNIDQMRENEQRALRIKVALDNVSSNIMVADNDFNIIYMNRELKHFFTDRADAIATEIQGFNADDLLNTNIDTFHKEPQRIRDFLNQLESSHRGQVTIAGLTFSQTINPVINDNGERLGYAVEWDDKTDQLEAEQAIQQLIQDAENGHMERRLSADHYQGFMKTLGSGINTVLDAIHTPLQEVIETLTALSNGDLTRRMEGAYSGEFATLKEAYNNSVGNLQDMVINIRTVANAITLASSEISTGTNDLSSRTSAQAASLEQTSASMEEMTSSVQQNAKHANDADRIASQTNQLASEGRDVVHQAIDSMERINQASDKIANIISTIDDIAFQTNLLALNAAVEAARAGEQGRGFAVVAGEVRSLAQKATLEAQNIKALVDETTESIGAGSSLVNRTGESLQSIAASTQQVSDVVAQITQASQEQSNGIGQVNNAIAKLDSANQQNAALVEETAASSSSMDQQARELEEMMSRFKTGG